MPNRNLTAVTARGLEDEDGAATIWQVVAHAVCAGPPPGLERAAATSALDSANVKTAVARCSPSKRLIGTGAAINAGIGQVVLDDIHPSGDLTHVRTKGVEDETGFNQPWSITAIAICSYPPSGLNRVAGTSQLGSAPTSEAGAPPCQVTLGRGSLINAGLGQVRGIFSDVHFGHLTVAATEDQSGFDGLWNMTAFSICADAASTTTTRSNN